MSILKKYVQDAIRTESQIETVTADYDSLVAIMKTFVAAGNMLDDFKKNIFYGKPIDQDKWDIMLRMATSEAHHITADVDKIELKKKPIKIDPRLLHALIGIATESTELIEAILTSFTLNKPIDQVNVLEEMGDIFWYSAIAIDATNGNWDQILETNIAKLKHRYPDKFTSENAINRDLVAEREILEKNEFSTEYLDKIRQRCEVRTVEQVLNNLHDY